MNVQLWSMASVQQVLFSVHSLQEGLCCLMRAVDFSWLGAVSHGISSVESDGRRTNILKSYLSVPALERGGWKGGTGASGS